MPHLYPFIVNDPGEGSQAKRRGHAVILDHLTPPLGRQALHGSLETLEGLLDEYVEANQLASERSGELNAQLLALLQDINWPGLPEGLKSPSPDQSLFDAPIWSDCLDQVETYLCELKEAQIRTGLHRLGTDPEPETFVELLLAISRAPAAELEGMTQRLANLLNLEVDPWGDEDGQPLSDVDQERLRGFTQAKPRRVADAVSWLDEQAMEVIRILIDEEETTAGSELHQPIQDWITARQRSCVPPAARQPHPASAACAEQEQRASPARDGRPKTGQWALRSAHSRSTGCAAHWPKLHSVDLRGLPTEAAWDLGRRSAERLLDLYLLEEGEPLQHLALSVWGTATMRNGGEDIAQLLALLGVRPVWDGPTRRMVDLEVIPLSLLGRPRVDVTLRMSGLFRDAFPQLITWVHRAQTSWLDCTKTTR